MKKTEINYYICFSASDDGGSTFGTVTVSLPLNDLNDNTPAFSSNTISATVADKAASGHTMPTLIVFIHILMTIMRRNILYRKCMSTLFNQLLQTFALQYINVFCSFTKLTYVLQV